MLQKRREFLCLITALEISGAAKLYIFLIYKIGINFLFTQSFFILYITILNKLVYMYVIYLFSYKQLWLNISIF